MGLDKLLKKLTQVYNSAMTFGMKLIPLLSCAIVAGIAQVASHSCATEPPYKYKLYYFPMTSQGMPINPISIKGYYDMTSVVQPQIPEILKVIDEAQPAIADLEDIQIRLRIEQADQTWLVDLRGRVLTPNSETKQLERADISKIKRLILQSCPVN